MACAERGETIWFRGDTVDYFGVVGIGFVKMVREAGHGQEVTVEIMGPGQVFGMLGSIEGVGCPLTARAVCESWFVRVPKSTFMPIYGDSASLKDHVVARTGARLRQAYDMLARMSTGRIEERIAAVLLILADSYGSKTDSGLRIEVPLTRQDISEMAGTTVESTIRTVSRWQKDGLIRTENRHIILVDEPAVAALLRG